MSVIIDPRAGSGYLLDDIKKRLNCSVELDTLDSGDVVFDGHGPNGNVLIAAEVKGLSDMLNSMRTGRCAEQIGRMVDSYDYTYLFILGIWRSSEDGIIETKAGGEWRSFQPISREQAAKGRKRRGVFMSAELDNFITSLEMRRGVVVRRASLKPDLVTQLCNLYGWWQKAWDSHVSVDAVKLQPTGIRYSRPSTLRLVAPQIPGIGAGRGAAVAKTFKTVLRMATASVEEWEAIENVGKVTAQKAFDAIRSEK